jgi:DNA-binding transcriptional LysR family regulator
MLGACAPSFPLAKGSAMEITALADHPLLVLDPSYATRNVFDAACHLADFKPNIFFESGSTSALLALAAAGHGVAIIPSALRTDPAKFRTSIITHRRKPLQFSVAVIWDKRRAPLRYVEAFSELLAAHLRAVYSDSKQSKVKHAAAARRAPVKKSRRS